MVTRSSQERLWNWEASIVCKLSIVKERASPLAAAKLASLV
jgi:hypothetical protein